MSLIRSRGVIGALLRGVCLLLVLHTVQWLVHVATASDGQVGADIGSGVAAFGAVIVTAALWGFADGSQAGTWRDLTVLWLVAGVVLGLGASLLIQVGGAPGFDATVWLSDLAGVGAFMVVLSGVPALLSAAGARARRRA